jgi:hypothetical protein
MTPLADSVGDLEKMSRLPRRNGFVEDGSQSGWDRRSNYLVQPLEADVRVSVRLKVQRRLRELMFLAAGARRSSTGQPCARSGT